MSKAEEVSRQFDEHGNGFMQIMQTRGQTMVASLEAATGRSCRACDRSPLAELNAAIESGSASSLGGIVEANDKLRTEVTALLGRLTDANQLLNGIVGSATKSLTEVEGRMAERVRGLEGTLAAILSASREGSDTLAAKVEAIRAASGDVLGHSEDAL